jgi:hypothetical protein
MRKSLGVCVGVNTALAVALALYLFVVPAAIIIHDLDDPGLGGGQIPQCAFRWHRASSPKYEKWARSRVRSGSAARLTMGNISATEWPLFGSVFYLWATEALQETAQDDPALCPVPPRQYARGAIEAAAALVADPNHAGWSASLGRRLPKRISSTGFCGSFCLSEAQSRHFYVVSGASAGCTDSALAESATASKQREPPIIELTRQNVPGRSRMLEAIGRQLKDLHGAM